MQLQREDEKNMREGVCCCLGYDSPPETATCPAALRCVGVAALNLSIYCHLPNLLLSVQLYKASLYRNLIHRFVFSRFDRKTPWRMREVSANP